MKLITRVYGIKNKRTGQICYKHLYLYKKDALEDLAEQDEYYVICRVELKEIK